MKKLLLFILLIPAIGFAQKDSVQKSSNNYFTIGVQLETPQYFGAKINYGITSKNKKEQRNFAFGLGIDIIRYNDPGLETTAFPIYFDIRYFLPISGPSIYVDGNGGYYNYSATSSITNPTSDGGYIKTDITTKGQPFFGFALGFILPFKKTNLYNGIYVMAGYRNVTFNNYLKEEKKEKLRNGGYRITSGDGDGSHFESGMFTFSIGVSIL